MLTSADTQCDDTHPPSSPLSRLVEMANSQDSGEVLQGVLLIRKLLEVKDNPPIQAVVESGVCGWLVACMQHANIEVQLNASLALSNIAASDASHAQYIVDLGAVSLWVQHLSSPSLDCIEQAVWALGNIADGTAHQDYILSMGAMPLLLYIIRTCPDKHPSLLQCAVWLVSLLCRVKGSSNFYHLAPAIPVLVQTLQHPDLEIASDSIFALSSICCRGNDRLQVIIDSGVVPLIVNILDSPHDKLHLPALRLIGNICSGDDSQTQLVIDAGCLSCIAQHLDPKSRPGVRKEAAWLLSNICAGNIAQIQAVIVAGLLPAIVSTIGASELEVKKDVILASVNLVTTGTSQQIRHLVEAGVLEAFCGVLNHCAHKRILIAALDAILEIIKSGADLMRIEAQATNIYVEYIRRFQGDITIKGLLQSDGGFGCEIQSLSRKILDYLAPPLDAGQRIDSR